MTTNMKSWSRRFAAAAGALAIGLVGLAGGALSAQADDTKSGNIDPTAQASLTIHKYDNTKQGDHGDGTEQDASTFGKALANVEFTIYKVTEKGSASIDLDTTKGWDLIDGIQATDVYSASDYAASGAVNEANGYVFNKVGTVMTDADGMATKDLDHGLYLVVETGYGDNNTITTPTDPFLVTLPLPQTNGGWLYDVHAYPKNAVDENTPTKEANEPTDGVILGSTVPWTISAPVQPDKPGEVTSFKITDQLDSRLSYVSVADVKNTTTNEALVEGTDFVVTDENGLVTIDFAKALSKLHVSDVITLTLNTKVESLGDGVIKNQATVFTNDNKGHGTSKPGEPGTNPSTNWGQILVDKYAQGNESNKLANAVFTVYKDEARTKEAGTFTTDANGKGEITLWVGNDDDTSEVYYISETTAPAGYTAVADDALANKGKVTVYADATQNVTISIADPQKNHPNLPLTGAAGMVVMTVAGMALIGAGAAAYVAARKRESVR